MTKDPDAKLAIAKCVEMLNEDHFYKESHRKIFDAITALFGDGGEVDLLTVTNMLEAMGDLDLVGGVPYLNEMIDSVPTASNATYYAEKVKAESDRRKIIYTTAKAGNGAYEPTEDVEQLLSGAIDELLSIKIGTMGEKPSFKSQLKAVFKDMKERSQNPKSIQGMPFGIRDVDRKIGGLLGGDLCIIAARPSMGKCLSGDALMVDATTGNRITAREFYAKKVSRTLSLNMDAESIETSIVTKHMKSGIQEVHAITTQQGATVEVTEEHPMLTPLGWRKLKDLIPGRSYVAVSAKIPDYGKLETMTDREALLLGYLLAEGTLWDTTIKVTTKSDDVLADLRNCVAEKDCILRTTPGRITYRIVRADGSRKPNSNPVRTWIKELGLFGTKSGTKFVPDIVFRQSNRKVSLLLSGLFSGDGWHSDHIGIVSKSKQMMLDVKHLLLRFGIMCRLKTDYNKRYDSYYYRLTITGHASKKAFCNKIGFRRHVPHPEMSQMENWGVSPYCTVGDVRFELVRNIKAMGKIDTYDFTIQSNHNFLANDVVVHNSTFVRNIAQYLCEDYKSRVAIFSLEMRDKQIMALMLASESKINYERFRSSSFTENDWQPLTDAAGRMDRWKCHIEDATTLSSFTPLDLRTALQRIILTDGKPDLVVFDYLQLMEPQRPTSTRTNDVSQISRQLKSMAMYFDIPFIVLSQLNRKVEERPNKRPMLSDLRESGAIEQDADIVCFLYDDDYYSEERGPRKGGECELIIAKQRMGPIGTVKVDFDLESARFLQVKGRVVGRQAFRGRSDLD